MAKILFCVNSLSLGGVERRLSQLMIGLARLNEHTLYCIINNNASYIQPEVVKYVTFICIEYYPNKDSVIQKYINIIRDISPDIIHCWTMRQCDIVNKISRDILKDIVYICGAVNSSHIYKEGSKHKNIMNVCIEKADLVISNSEAGALAKGIPNNKLCVIKNGYDFEFDTFSRHTKKSKEFAKIIKHYEFVILMACRICPEKDTKTFLKLASSFQGNRNFIFILLGDGIDCTDSFINKIKKYKNVIFLGYQQNIGAYIKQAKICVLFSNPPHGEGISNFIMESMAQNKVVIATRGGGTNEIITHYHNGLLVNPHDVEQVCEYIELLTKNKVLYENLANKALQTIKTSFNFSEKLKQYNSVYKHYIEKC